MAYIWKSEQTEPGMTGTHTRRQIRRKRPPRSLLRPSPGAENLTYPESIYSDWKLIGTAKGDAFRSAIGEYIIDRETGGASAGPTMVEDVVRCGWYSKA